MVQTKRAAANSEKALNAVSIAFGEACEAGQPKIVLTRSRQQEHQGQGSGEPEELEDELAADDRNTDKILLICPKTVETVFSKRGSQNSERFWKVLTALRPPVVTEAPWTHYVYVRLLSATSGRHMAPKGVGGFWIHSVLRPNCG
ncbi:hypothetical protein B0H17DRAFT_1142029 [Mycena rosella]|uniref:Uncharacterized protein n=1 Tax=Mycena rosella TaxID=1033263 RepID=A0AAD7CYT4_MYCRO|nr:hypothetical protein B0H17DRAFT_1142029 [Mycena rosella]